LLRQAERLGNVLRNFQSESAHKQNITTRLSEGKQWHPAEGPPTEKKGHIDPNQAFFNRETDHVVGTTKHVAARTNFVVAPTCHVAGRTKHVAARTNFVGAPTCHVAGCTKHVAGRTWFVVATTKPVATRTAERSEPEA
jgi:hypothetical protein